ncbi:MAG TPA: class III signal peptide-containing protein [Tepidiformaceae bacterium]|nr:class III signal peptide-containing protein [Tepidiformaceae bacterium]
MQVIRFVQAWLADKLGWDERGQGTVEYVLLILGVVLFLIVAAFALQGVLSGAISKISSWMGIQSPP